MNEIALIGKKIGMTREFYKTGQLVPVTVLKMEKARVIEIIDEKKRGYKAIQLGYGKIKASKLTKQMKGYFAKKNTEAKKKLKEYRVLNSEGFKEGNEFGLEIFKDVKFVDTRSKTIGKGIGPFIVAPVLLTVLTISSVEASNILLSYALSLILIFCFSIVTLQSF